MESIKERNKQELSVGLDYMVRVRHYGKTSILSIFFCHIRLSGVQHCHYRCLIEIAISSSFRWIVAGLSPIARIRKQLHRIQQRISENRTLNILVFYGIIAEYEFGKIAGKMEELEKRLMFYGSPDEENRSQ